MWYVYILKCNDDSFYVGVTNNLIKRVKRHNDGSGSQYTKIRRPVLLIYSENYLNRMDAMKREVVVKGLSRVNKEKLINLRPSPDLNKG